MIDFEEDEAEKAVARQEVKDIRLQQERLETTFLLILWYFLLSQFNAVNRKLQAFETCIVEVIEHYKGLQQIVLDCRKDFDHLEQRALELLDSNEYCSSVSRKRKRILKLDESRGGEIELTGRDKFRVNTSNVILDDLMVELQKRCRSYENVDQKFSIITRFNDLHSTEEIRTKSKTLIASFTSDLKSNSDNEFIHFHAFFKANNIQLKSPQ